MLVIATFENSSYIELAIATLENNGIGKKNIFAAPLEKKKEPKALFDTIHSSDGFSLFDLSAILGTCFMLLGAIYGYVLKWGPIIWGIIGIVVGVFVGFLIKFILIKGQKTGTGKITSEIVIMIRCHANHCDKVSTILWEHHALGLSKVDR